jgi:hypothetical protein
MCNSPFRRSYTRIATRTIVYSDFQRDNLVLGFCVVEADAHAALCRGVARLQAVQSDIPENSVKFTDFRGETSIGAEPSASECRTARRETGKETGKVQVGQNYELWAAAKAK